MGPEPGAQPVDKPNRNLSPDVPPRRGKAKGEFKSERGPKRPMREIVRGQFFSGSDEDDDYDEYEDYDAETDEERSDADLSDPEKSP